MSMRYSIKRELSTDLSNIKYVVLSRDRGRERKGEVEGKRDISVHLPLPE